MSKYNVYGIGNALVDMEFEVNEDFLNQTNIEKGLMTLVDENRLSQLLNEVEGVKHKRSCGGSAANTIIAVSQLGGKSFYSCKVASDETGDFYTEDLHKEGVKTNLADKREEGVTGKCMVFVTPDADRTMNTYLGITANFSMNDLVEEELLQAQYLYIEGYLVTSENGMDAIFKAQEIAKKNGIKIAVTFSDPGIVTHFKSQFEKIIEKGVDLIFCNEAEALSFTGTENLTDAGEKLSKLATSYAITRGADGAVLYDGEKKYEIAAPKVEAVDTNGAGDLFAGSFLYGITNNYTYEESGKLACSMSAKLVTQFGARLERSQSENIKSEVLS